MTRREDEKPAAVEDTPLQAEELQEPPLSYQVLREDFQSEEYQEALQQNFETRARVGRVLGCFFLDTAFGRALIKTRLFTNPIDREREKFENRIKVLASQMQETLPCLSRQDAERTARLEPDFLPHTQEKVVLEVSIDRYAQLRAIMKSDYDRNRDIDYRFDMDFRQMKANGLNVSPQASEILTPLFPEVLLDRKIAHVRDRFYNLLSDKDWEGLFDLLYHQHRAKEIGKLLQLWVFDRRHFIFPNEHFRRTLFKKIMTLLIVEGQIEFERFDQFLQEAGLDFSDPEELKTLSKIAFPTDHWYEVMRENPRRYCFLQDYLSSFGICP